jgi:hypothetical protein
MNQKSPPHKRMALPHKGTGTLLGRGMRRERREECREGPSQARHKKPERSFGRGTSGDVSDKIAAPNGGSARVLLNRLAYSPTQRLVNGGARVEFPRFQLKHD